jgi:hypothetical protein
MHCDGDLGSIRELFCAYFHSTLVNVDVSGVKPSLVVGISRVRSKDDGTFYNDGIQLRSLINIHKEVEA